MNKNKEQFNRRMRNDKQVRTLNDDELARVQQIYLQMVTDIVHNRNDKVSLGRWLCLFAGKMLSFRKSEKYFDKVDCVNQYKNEKTKLVGLPGGRYHYIRSIQFVD